MVASWLVARWFLGGELVGGETSWWRDDRIPVRLRDDNFDRTKDLLQKSFFFPVMYKN